MLKLTAVICAIISVRAADPLVCFDKGCVRGKTINGNVKEFEGFLGIPYAKKPINELRLKVSPKQIAQLNVNKYSHGNLCIESEIKESFTFFSLFFVEGSPNSGQMERGLRRNRRKTVVHAKKLSFT